MLECGYGPINDLLIISVYKHLYCYLSITSVLSPSSPLFLLHRLCFKKWGKVSAYSTDYPVSLHYQASVSLPYTLLLLLFLLPSTQLKNSYKKLYLVLDNGTLTFAADPHEGISYLIAMGVLEDSPQAIAEFIHHTALLDWKSLRQFLQER